MNGCFCMCCKCYIHSSSQKSHDHGSNKPLHVLAWEWPWHDHLAMTISTRPTSSPHGAWRFFWAMVLGFTYMYLQTRISTWNIATKLVCMPLNNSNKHNPSSRGCHKIGGAHIGMYFGGSSNGNNAICVLGVGGKLCHACRTHQSITFNSSNPQGNVLANLASI